MGVNKQKIVKMLYLYILFVQDLHCILLIDAFFYLDEMKSDSAVSLEGRGHKTTVSLVEGLNLSVQVSLDCKFWNQQFEEK